jgi:hypothetical protein
MTAIAGLDLGYGSQIKIVRTNYLLVGADTAGTAQAHANLLQMYNYSVMNRASGNNRDTADYIVSVSSSASGALTAEAPTNSTTDPRVISSTTLTNWPVMGPSATSLGTQADLGFAGADSAADMGCAANGDILCVLGYGQMSFGALLLDGEIVEDTLGGTGGTAQDLNSRLMVARSGSTVATGAMAGRIPHLDMTEAFATFIAGVAGDGLAADFTAAALTTGFVSKGNSTGATPTEISDLGNIVADTAGMISITTLVAVA